MSFPVLCTLLEKKITNTSFYPVHTMFGLLDLPVLLPALMLYLSICSLCYTGGG